MTPQLNASDMNSYKIIISKIQEELDNAEFMELARIVILDCNDSIISFFQDNFSVTNGRYEEVSGDQFTTRFGFTVRRAYLLRCRKLET